ncbi:MAG: hypothetical protein AAFO70_03485, partial [Pseudomonadota bacterium]
MKLGAKMQQDESAFLTFRRLLFAAAILTTLLFGFTFSIDTTKATFLSSLSGQRIAFVFVETLSLLLLGAAFATILATAVGSLIGRYTRPMAGRFASYLILALMLTVFAVLPLEDIAYSVSPRSIKGESGRLVTFGYLAVLLLFLAFAWNFVRENSQTNAARHPVAAAIIALVIAIYPARVVLTSLSSGETGADVVGVATPYDIVIMSADGISAKRMGVYGYERETTPFLSSVADEFLVVENAYTNNVNSRGSVVS